MKKVLLAAAIAALSVLTMALPAQAAPWNDHDMYGTIWFQTATIDVVFEYGFGAQKRDTLELAFEEWDQYETGVNFVGYTVSGNPFHTEVCSEQEDDSVYVMWANLGNNTPLVLGTTDSCGGSSIDKGVLKLNENSAVNWNYVGTDAPANNEQDLRSTAAHEVGHVLGFYGYGCPGGVNTYCKHWSESSTACPDGTTNRETMCPSIAVGTIYARTLETNDLQEFIQNY